MQLSNRSVLFLGSVSVVLFFGTLLLTKQVVLGGAQPITVQPAPALTGQLSQVLGTTKGGGLPVSGKDYRADISYLNDKTWVVAFIKPLSNDFNGTPVVMEKVNGVYQVILGPGGAFSSKQLNSLPNNVRAALLTRTGSD